MVARMSVCTEIINGNDCAMVILRHEKDKLYHNASLAKSGMLDGADDSSRLP